jgi:hypothetical protein
MRSIETVKGQTLMDLAIQEYGSFEAVFLILEDNPHIAGLNDFPQGYLVDGFCDFDLAHPIKPGVKIYIREDSELTIPSVLRQINGQKIISE